MSDTTTTEAQEDPKDLRAKLEAALTENKSLKGENAGFKANQQLNESGFGHLSERQRRTILRDLADEGKDISAENVKALADEHGYPTSKPEPKSETTATETQTTDDQNGEVQPDPVDASLSGFSHMQNADQVAISGKIDPSFEDKIKKAKSKDEVRSIIRQDGARAGLVHSWDVD